jgi:integrase
MRSNGTGHRLRATQGPNTHRKYEAVLKRFVRHFRTRTFESITDEELNDFVVDLKKSGMSANTVLHNVIIIAQFSKRNGRPGLTRILHLPERTTPLPREYTEEELLAFFAAADDRERELFTTFLLTGFREQEVAYLFWTDVNFRLRTIRVTSKPHLGFSPKRWEERQVPVPVQLTEMLEARPHTWSERLVFPSPTGRHEQNMLLKCKAVAERAGLDPVKFDLKTFRSTYATRMLRAGFDVRTVQQWMGHKSLETTMRYLVPATDVHDRLDQISVPGSGDRKSVERAS